MNPKVLVIGAQNIKIDVFKTALEDHFNLVFIPTITNSDELINLIISTDSDAVFMDHTNSNINVDEIVTSFKKENEKFPLFLTSNQVVAPQGISPFHVFLPTEIMTEIFPKQLNQFIKNYKATKDKLLNRLNEIQLKPLREMSIEDENNLTNIDSELKRVVLGYTPLREDQKPHSLVKSLDKMLEIANKMNDAIKK